MKARLFTLILLTLSGTSASAFDLSGRFSMLGSMARAEAGDAGYQTAVGNLLSADQQSLRLMAEEGGDSREWSAHLRATRTHSHGFPTSSAHSSALFRYTELSDEIVDESDGVTATSVRYEVDRLYYRYHFDHSSISVGRQPIDWGSGRFWQPLNVFGSFAAIDLDTDYKPGIDALVIDHYPSPLSSLTAVYAFAPHDQDTIENSAALHYRRQIGGLSEMSVVAGSITGNTVLGASFESAWQEIGWRIEGLHYELRDSDEKSLFWIAGIEYQFDNGTLLHLEYYDNARGAMTESHLSGIFADTLVATGLQQHLTRQLIGIGLSRDITPLLSGNYTLLGSVLDDDKQSMQHSQLHQLNLIYSVSNESDLLASLLIPTGKGLDLGGDPQSEFGHLPMSFTLRLRFYF